MSDAALLVDTATGTIAGCHLPSGGRLFAGIPFAAAPVGELRWRPPQPPEPWPGVRRSDRFRAAPAQGASPNVPGASPKSTFPTFPTAQITETSEDCLYLNVWVPAGTGDTALRPVIVWIYGGGFEAGSAAPPYSDGDALARQTGAVVVAANYRLGAFGFLHLADLGTRWSGATNFAIQDQVAALGWVAANIRAFGGDPANVTVAGQSAGAFSIGTLLGVPAASGLFAKAILHSGGTSRILSRDTANTMTENLLAALRLDDPENLLKVPTQDIMDAQTIIASTDIGSRNLPGGHVWGVVLDGVVLPRDPLRTVADGAVAHIPLLIGATHDEIRLFQRLAGDAFRPADRTALLAEMQRAGVTEPDELLRAYRSRAPHSDDLSDLRSMFLTDAVYRIPATDLAQAQSAAGGRAYHQLLLAEPCGPDLGAFHGADLLYLFDKLALVDAARPEHLAVRDLLIGAWTDFAVSGAPRWPAYASNEEANSRAIAAPPIVDSMITEPPDDIARLWLRPSI
ncbi:carboxylesterase/lipase family protein [Nocardia colli]|uniref:carboxylesterase/lipase family protein n=1 Tax=Nocardia colli TaxID=2545717 RepID=UPI0035DF0489